MTDKKDFTKHLERVRELSENIKVDVVKINEITVNILKTFDENKCTPVERRIIITSLEDHTLLQIIELTLCTNKND